MSNIWSPPKKKFKICYSQNEFYRDKLTSPGMDSRRSAFAMGKWAPPLANAIFNKLSLLMLLSMSPGTVSLPLLACLGGDRSLLDRPHPAHMDILLCSIPRPKSAQSTHFLCTLASDWLTCSGLPRHTLKLSFIATLCPAGCRAGLKNLMSSLNNCSLLSWTMFSSYSISAVWSSV